MNNHIDGISFVLSSLEDFEDKQLARDVISSLLSASVQLVPKTYGKYKGEQKITDLEKVVDIFTNEPLRNNIGSSDFFSGSLLLSCDRNRNCEYQVGWCKWRDKPGFPFLAGRLMTNLIQIKPSIFEDFCDVVKKLVPIVKPVYGEIRNMMFEGWDIPQNLTKRLPDIPSISIYGSPYINLFGKQTIESSPFNRMEEFLPGYYWLEANTSVFKPVPNDKKEAIRSHFGEDAFMKGHKWQYESGTAPNFDFSKVFLKTKS